MEVLEGLIREEKDGTISFGNHKLEQKEKTDNFIHLGDLYRIKTYKAITKLKKNGMLIYESVPGTTVSHFEETEKGVTFSVSGKGNTQITAELEAEVAYQVYMNEKSLGTMKTNFGGKLNVSVELNEIERVVIKIIK